MLSLLFLEIIGLLSIHVTTPTERYTAPHSSVLRIGLAVIVYLLIAWMKRTEFSIFIIFFRYIYISSCKNYNSSKFFDYVSGNVDVKEEFEMIILSLNLSPPVKNIYN